jgi:hypothetical protein
LLVVQKERRKHGKNSGSAEMQEDVKDVWKEGKQVRKDMEKYRMER